MNAIHRPVVHPCCSQCAAIAATLIEYAPGVEGMAFILPDCFEDFDEVMRLGLADAKRLPACPERGSQKTFCQGYYLHNSSYECDDMVRLLTRQSLLQHEDLKRRTAR